jgi:hypothetical protein
LSIKVMQWVWDCSRSKNAQRLVLLAIADCASEDGGNAYPSNVELQRKAALSERAVRDAVAGLMKLGELDVSINGGRRGTNMYRIIMTPCERSIPAESAPPKKDAPAGSAPQEGQDLPLPPAESAPGTVLEPSLEPSGSTSPAAAAGPNAGLVIKAWIDHCTANNVILTPQVIARYGKGIKSLLGAKIPELTIKKALALMLDRGKAGWPSMLDSFVVEVQNGAVAQKVAPKSFKQQDADSYDHTMKVLLLAEEVAEKHGLDINNDEVRAGLIKGAKEHLAKGLEPSAFGVYSDQEAINGLIVDPPLEVTAS